MRKPWSDCAYVQADLSPCWAHKQLCRKWCGLDHLKNGTSMVKSYGIPFISTHLISNNPLQHQHHHQRTLLSTPHPSPLTCAIYISAVYLKSRIPILGMSGYVIEAIPREQWLNYLQTVETLIRRRILRRQIWVCTVCQLTFWGSQD